MASRHPAIIPPLTGLRFVAAFYVLLYHYGFVLPYPPVLALVLRHGSAGVDLFYVLSGFVLTYTYAETFRTNLDGYRAFLQARLARIAPMNAVALLLVTPLTLAILPRLGIHLSTATLVLSWLANLTLTEAWVPNAAMAIWDAPAGSVSAELLFYLAFPLVVRYFLSPLSGDRQRLEAAGATIVGTASAILLAVAILGPGSASTLVYTWPPFRVGEFILGCLGGLVYLGALDGRRTLATRLRHDVVWRERVILYSVSAFVALAAVSPPWLDAFLYPLQAPLALALILALASGPSRVSRLLSHRTVLFLGEASYSLYLLHIIPLTALHFLTDAPDPGVGVAWWTAWHRTRSAVLIALGLIPLTVLASVACYRWIEAPARRALRPRRIHDFQSVVGLASPSASATER
jgi:peptidoglycan/LPS O-acetylase OafA/YrhL